MSRNHDPFPTIVDQLAALPLFEGCSDRELRRVADVVEPTSIRAGRLVMLERHRGEQFHVIVEGRARVTRGEEVVAVLGAGDLLGEIALLDQVDRTAMVTAETDLRLLTFGLAGFRHLMQDHPTVAARIRAAAASRRPATEVG